MKNEKDRKRGGEGGGASTVFRKILLIHQSIYIPGYTGSRESEAERTIDISPSRVTVGWLMGSFVRWFAHKHTEG